MKRRSSRLHVLPPFLTHDLTGGQMGYGGEQEVGQSIMTVRGHIRSFWAYLIYPLFHFSELVFIVFAPPPGAGVRKE